jgi:hypothetical protein
MSKQMKNETEAALVGRRTKEVELAKVLSSPEAQERRRRNGERAKAKAKAAERKRREAEEQVRIAPMSNEPKAKASAPRQQANEWFFGQTKGPDAGYKPLGPFTSQLVALEAAQKEWPAHADRLNRRLSRFVRIGCWINTAKLKNGERLTWHATTREANDGLFNLPKGKPAASEAEKALDKMAEKITPASAKKHGIKLYPATIKGKKTLVSIPGASEPAPKAKVHESARVN